MPGPLAGVRILESTTMITGPLAGQMLGDLGARIVKVENPDGGDLFRAFRGGYASPYFAAYNRNKRSIALDLRSDAGREIYLKLVAQSDVLIENFRPGVLDRLGLGLDVLRAANPQLILCSITGFGPDGPYRDRPAYDAVAQAVSGISSLFLGPDAQITGPTIADNMTGIFAAYGILGALYERKTTGVARTVAVNMLDSALAFMPDPFVVHTLLGLEPGPLMRVSASQSYALPCADGKVMAVHISSQEKFWAGLCRALGRGDLMIDPRFADRAGRIDNYLALAAELKTTAATRPRGHWMALLEQEDVPHAPVNTLPDVFEDPQVKHLGSFADVPHVSEGTFKSVRRPVYYDGSRADQPLTAPPALNADGEAVLAEFGVDEALIARWRQNRP